jgi:hypothetical protein
MQHGTPREFTKESARPSAAKDREREEIINALWGDNRPTSYEPNLAVAVRQLVANLKTLRQTRERELDQHHAELATLREDKERLTREIQELKVRFGLKEADVNAGTATGRNTLNFQCPYSAAPCVPDCPYRFYCETAAAVDEFSVGHGLKTR